MVYYKDMAKPAPPEFVVWVERKMDEKGWSARQTATRAGISHSLITYITRGEQPSLKTCKALAKAFGEPEPFVTALAGVTAKEPGWSPGLAEWTAAYGQLTNEDQVELLTLAKLKIGRRKKKT